MKTKMEMAHEYALEMLKETIPTGSLYGEDARSVAESIVKSAFALADMMQAEADKREDKTRPEELCEVDWRAAPAWATEWNMSNGVAHWLNEKGCQSSLAPSFGFTGNHIVERPL